MKEFGKIVIYILLTIGAIVMLMPFGWMISTSFKLPSEVEKWPPQWGSRNFLPNRYVKVVKDYSGGRLILNVDDDAFLRGTVYITFEGSPTYASNIPKEKFMEIYEKYRDILKMNPSYYRDFGDFISDSFKLLKETFTKTSFKTRIVDGLKALQTQLSTVERFIKVRVKDEKEQKELLGFVRKLKREIEKAYLDMEELYRSLDKILLGREDLKKVVAELNRVLNLKDSEPSLKSKQGKIMLRFIDSKIFSKIIDFSKPYKAYLEFESILVNSQDSRIDGNLIVGRVKTKGEKIRDLEKAFSKNPDLKRYWEKIKEKAFKEPDKSLLYMEVSINSDRDEELKRLVESMTGRYSEKLYKALMNIIKKMEDAAYGKEVNVSSFIKKYDSLRAAVEEFSNVIIEKAKEMPEYREAYKMEGLKTTLDAVRSYAKEIYSLMGASKKDPIFAVKSIYKINRKYDSILEKAEKLFDKAVYSLVIIKKPKTDILKDVRVHIYKGRDMTKEDISLYFDVHSINFYDDKVKVHVKFNAGEIFKNVFQNYVDAWFAAPFGRYYINTVFVATMTTILEVILASMAAFAFSVLSFPGRDFFFSLFLATMMVPGEVLLVPNFITITKLGWIDTYYALIVPWIVSVFAIFLIRQHFMTLPRELYDASKIDGCSNWRYLWTIAVPLSKPVIITGALLKFVGSWNAFLWVLIVTNSEKYRTLPVGLHTFSSEAGTIYNQLMAAATFSVLPIIILFLFVQKYFIRGIARTGLK